MERWCCDYYARAYVHSFPPEGDQGLTDLISYFNPNHNVTLARPPFREQALIQTDSGFRNSSKKKCSACRNFYWEKKGPDHEKVTCICRRCARTVANKDSKEGYPEILVCDINDMIDIYLYIVYRDIPAFHIQTNQWDKAFFQ